MKSQYKEMKSSFYTYKLTHGLWIIDKLNRVGVTFHLVDKYNSVWKYILTFLLSVHGRVGVESERGGGVLVCRCLSGFRR